MSLLRDLPSDLLSEVLLYADRSTLLHLARSSRNLAAEIGDKQDWTWAKLVERDWGDGGEEQKTQQQQQQQQPAQSSPVSSPMASPSPPPHAAGNEEDASSSRERGGVHRQPGESWRDVYRRYALHFGPTARCYARVAPVWKRLLAWINEHQADLPRIKETIASTFPTGSRASSAFAAASAAASGASPLPSPSPSYAEMAALQAQKQLEWRMFQLHMRRQLQRELDDEARQADGKREGKRGRSATAAAAAASAASTSAAAAAAGGSGSSASPSVSPAGSRGSPSNLDAADSATMDFETAIGLPPRETAPSASEQKQLEEQEGAPPLSEIRVDPELMCTLLLHNGQSEVTRAEQVPTGLFGGFQFYSFGCQYRLMDFASMVGTAVAEAQQTMEHDALLAKKTRAQNKRRRSDTDAGRAGAGAGAAVGSSSDALVAAASCPTSAEVLLPFTFSPIGASVEFYLRSSTGAVVRRCYDGSLHAVAPSFLSFFARYVSDLEAGRFAFSRGRGINRFPLRSDTGSITVTRAIRIEVSVLFVPEQSVPDAASHAGSDSRFFFAYHVRIDHDGSAATRAQLVSRHWIIEDATGKVETVQGPGVVGLTPSIYPGCPLFTYESCSPIRTRKGKMHGSFRFKMDNTDEEFDAVINTFHFDADRNYC